MKTEFISAVLVGCLAMTACVYPQDAEPVTLKYPYSVETAQKCAVEPPESPEIASAELVEEILIDEEKAVETQNNECVSESVIPESVLESAGEYQEPQEIVQEEIVPEEVYDSDFPEPVETGNYYEDIPDETSEAWQYEEYEEPQGMQLLGMYHITHYSAEGCGNNIGAAQVEGGMLEGVSIAMPEYWMLGCWVYVEGYGQFRVDDISPDGIADIFHWAAADAVGEDWQNVYLIG